MGVTGYGRDGKWMERKGPRVFCYRATAGTQDWIWPGHEVGGKSAGVLPGFLADVGDLWISLEMCPGVGDCFSYLCVIFRSLCLLMLYKRHPG